MNKKQSQSGFAHLIIIIVLVVALIGALGFVFWQNFIQKETDISQNDNRTKTLTVSEWGIRGTYTSDSTLEYQFDNAGSGNLQLTDKNPGPGGCETSEISRLSGEQKVSEIISGTTGITVAEYYSENFNNIGFDSSVRYIGGYYYFYIGTFAPCAEANLDKTHAVRTAAPQFLLSLESI